MVSAVRRHIIEGGGAEINKSRRRRRADQQKSAVAPTNWLYLTAEISGVLERLDRVEESLQGSGKGSPSPDYWITRPGVTACQVVAPGPSGQPQSSMVNLRESDYTERPCPETEPLRRSLRLLNKPRPDYRFSGILGETELPWVPTESLKERERPDFGHQPTESNCPKTTIPLCP